MTKEYSLAYDDELAFEADLAEVLHNSHGWDGDIIMYPSEEDLIQNWANILYENNRDINILGDYPLTKTEMQQILDKVNALRNPFEVNRFINGKQVSIKRDNEADKHNCGKDVYLKIFDPDEICAGQSRYQIVRQPRFKAAQDLGRSRRGDMMLLINGMPVIHIELKKTGVDVSQATFQIKGMVTEGILTNGIFKLIQIFVAMTPEKTLYFANPGAAENFKPEFFFHWADFNNEEVFDWRQIANNLLSIPMAHQLIGSYTIADEKDETLKVLRSYQYFATTKICDRTHQTNWDTNQHRGGFIWHTTGSGKTMTSFKAAQLIANSGDADKVVFLLDRIELSLQSLDEYRGFAGEDDSIQDTTDTSILMAKLKSSDADNRLIVTSMQKMALVNADHPKITQADIDLIGRKRLVFIVDECHRGVFGNRLLDIKQTFPHALLFGFTGTPVFEENAHNEITTETIFGDMLHKYTLASGIPDKNVLGFDPYLETTYIEEELREKVAFSQLKVHSLDEIKDDEDAMRVYNKFRYELKMPSTYNDEITGEKMRGIESYLPKDIYRQDVHHQRVAENIVSNLPKLSKNGKFHAILATENIPEAIEYYNLFKKQYPSLRVAAVFDNSTEHSDEGIAKEQTLREMLLDYNQKYGTSFSVPTYALYKKDVAKRLAHKKPYLHIEHDMQIDLLIVVTQMLTGYDSKWVNTLYVDKLMKYVDLIQSFSRTNRLFGPDKPFGIIKYYTFPYTMKQNIEDALEVYVDRPLGVFVDKLEMNLMNINRLFHHISDIFKSHKIEDFIRLPDTREDRNMFAKDFIQMTRLIEAAKFQGFSWDVSEYTEFKPVLRMDIDEPTYMVLLQRYRELFEGGGDGPGDDKEFDYPVNTYLIERGTGTIDAEFLNAKFDKFIKNLFTSGPDSELTKEAFKELHKTFATLSQRDQRTAMMILHDLESGDLHLEHGKTIQDYIAEYQRNELFEQIKVVAEATGLNMSMLNTLLHSDVTEKNLNDYGRFDILLQSKDVAMSKTFVEKVEGKAIKGKDVNKKTDKLLRQFILDGAARESILKAYMGIGDEVNVEYTEEDILTQPKTSDCEIDIVKQKVKDILTTCIPGVLPQMRSMKEILNSVFYVINTKSIDSLDGVDLFIKRAFDNLYGKEANLIDKHIAFNLLVTKFEAYLKKLYYLTSGKELVARNEGDTPSFKDALYAHKSLWNLKWSTDPDKQQLYQWLMLVKGWRNEESHIAPTASEMEVDAAINIILTMYFYVTGSSITDLEIKGHNMDISPTKGSQQESTSMHVVPYLDSKKNDDEPVRYGMVADSSHLQDLPEEQRIDIFKKSLSQMLGYNIKKSPFTKQRHWVAIYRIAADYGFVIENDYAYFMHFIKVVGIDNLPSVNESVIERMNKGVYAKHIDDWNTDGLSEKELVEYNDIKKCADAFKTSVEKNIPHN